MLLLIKFCAIRISKQKEIQLKLFAFIFLHLFTSRWIFMKNFVLFLLQIPQKQNF